MKSFFIKTVTVRKLTVKFKLIIFLLFLLTIAFSYEHFFKNAGAFLEMGRQTRKVDAIVLQSSPSLLWRELKMVNNLLKNNISDKLYIVLHKVHPTDGIIDMPDYIKFVMRSIEKNGIPRDSYEIISMHVKHPVTIHEAEAVLPVLKRDKKNSILLLASSFHMRRSYLAYKKIMSEDGVVVYPHFLSREFSSEDWWETAAGFRHLAGEAFKYVFYVMKGYI